MKSEWIIFCCCFVFWFGNTFFSCEVWGGRLWTLRTFFFKFWFLLIMKHHSRNMNLWSWRKVAKSGVNRWLVDTFGLKTFCYSHKIIRKSIFVQLLVMTEIWYLDNNTEVNDNAIVFFPHQGSALMFQNLHFWVCVCFSLLLISGMERWDKNSRLTSNFRK